MGKRVVLADHKAKLAERGLDIVEGDETFHVDPPQLWPDAALDCAKDEDLVGMAKALLGGAERYAAFVAAGGTAGLLASIVEEEFEASVPE